MTFILGVALSARQTREGVRSIAHGPAHPVDGSRPHSRARRPFLNGGSIVALAGVPAHLPAHVHTRRSVPHMAHSVCRTSQVSICELPGATETSWVVLAQLSVKFQMGRACLHAVYGLRRACARMAIRLVSVACLHARHSEGRICRTRVHLGLRQ